MSVAFLLAEIRALKLELARFDPRAGMPVLPPPGAPPSALIAVERKLGRALPDAYRELLALHDGFPQFYLGASLLSTSQIVRGSFIDVARMMIDLGDSAPASWSHRRPALVPFGIDSRAETIFAFDCGGSSAELGIVLWTNEIGVRLDDFPAFLDFVIEMLQSDVDERRALVEPRSQRRFADPWGLALSQGRDRSAHAA